MQTLQNKNPKIFCPTKLCHNQIFVFCQPQAKSFWQHSGYTRPVYAPFVLSTPVAVPFFSGL